MHRNSSILTISLVVCALAACKPPATSDDPNRNQTLAAADGPSAPIESPDTEGAVWVDSDRVGRLIYGKPGATPLIALACDTIGGERVIHITRFAAADPETSAMMALVGNGHTARLPIDAKWNEQVWLWEGYYPVNNPDLDVLTGPRRIEATVPGAGSVILNASQRPARLIEACRRSVLPTPQPVPPPTPEPTPWPAR